MRLVVDASVAVKWLIAEDGSDASRGLVASGDEIYAPRLMVAEIANTLWRQARLGEIERQEAEAMIAVVPGMPVHWSADEAVCVDALHLAQALDRVV